MPPLPDLRKQYILLKYTQREDSISAHRLHKNGKRLQDAWRRLNFPQILAGSCRGRELVSIFTKFILESEPWARAGGTSDHRLWRRPRSKYNQTIRDVALHMFVHSERAEIFLGVSYQLGVRNKLKRKYIGAERVPVDARLRRPANVRDYEKDCEV